MDAFEDFSCALTKLGFIPNQHEFHFKHAAGTEIIFVPTISEYPQRPQTSHPIIVHEDIWRSKKEAVLNRLMALTGHSKRMHGRQCIVKRIDNLTAQQFLNHYHTGGFVNSYFKYGLFGADELLAVGLFSKVRTFHKDTDSPYRSAELTRYACKTGIRVTGGLDKLLNAFCNENKVFHLMTYADKEWTDGKSYFTLGFEKVGDTTPLLFRIHKISGERNVIHKNQYEFNEDWVLKSNLGNIKLVRTKNPRN